MEGKIQTQKRGFPENFAPKILGSCISPILPKNMGKSCVFVINLMVRDYFWGITELNQEKMTVA